MWKFQEIHWICFSCFFLATEWTSVLTKHVPCIWNEIILHISNNVAVRIWRLLHSCSSINVSFYYFLFFLNLNLFILIKGQLLYNIVLVLPYINMNPPQVYTYSPSWTPLTPPAPYHPSGSSQCTSPKLPVSCLEPGLAIHFLHDIMHVSMPFSQIIPPHPLTQSRSMNNGVNIEINLNHLEP